MHKKRENKRKVHNKEGKNSIFSLTLETSIAPQQTPLSTPTAFSSAFY